MDDCPEGARVSFHEQAFSAGSGVFVSLDKVKVSNLGLSSLSLSHQFFSLSPRLHIMCFFSPVQSNGVADTLKWIAALLWETKENTDGRMK